MAIAIGLWSTVLTPGKNEAIVPQADVRISNVALGDVLADQNGRSTVKLTFDTLIKMDEDDEEEVAAPPATTTILCSLTPGKVEQAAVDLILEEGEEYTFEVVGKNTIYVTGNYIDQTAGADRPPYDDEDDSDLDSEEAYDLRDVSSDVEMAPEDLELDGDETDASRFEEVVEEKIKSQKRPRESDVAESTTAKPIKAEKKNKKQKAEDGKAVPTGADKEVKETKEEEKKEKKKDQKEKKVVEKEIAGGIKIWDSKVGTGPMAKKGNTVSMRYIGKLQDGKVFDKNTKGKPFTFHLGRGEVIKGWDEGIVGMQVGGERKLTLPPAMAYGKRGTDGIPPNSTLIFEVKMMEIK